MWTGNSEQDPRVNPVDRISYSSLVQLTQIAMWLNWFRKFSAFLFVCLIQQSPSTDFRQIFGLNSQANSEIIVTTRGAKVEKLLILYYFPNTQGLGFNKNTSAFEFCCWSLYCIKLCINLISALLKDDPHLCMIGSEALFPYCLSGV